MSDLFSNDSSNDPSSRGEPTAGAEDVAERLRLFGVGGTRGNGNTTVTSPAHGAAPPPGRGVSSGELGADSRLLDHSHDEQTELTKEAVEVVVYWGQDVLHVSHHSPLRGFSVGEDVGRTDFFLPASVLGARHIPLVEVREGMVSLVIPRFAKGYVELPRMERQDLEAVRNVASRSGVEGLEGACEISLPFGARARIELGFFAFQVSVVRAGRPVKKGLGVGMDRRMWGTALGSFASFGLLAGALWMSTPPFGLQPEGELDKERLVLIQHYLDSAAEREREPVEQEGATSPEQESAGSRSRGPESAMGKRDSPSLSGKFSSKGPRDNPRPELSRGEMIELARNSELIGLLRATAASEALSSPWATEVALGNHDKTVVGQMFGGDIHEAAGFGGFGLSGIGEPGGGGNSLGVGLNRGDVGGMGPCVGTGCNGSGRSVGILGQRGHTAKAPNPIRTGNVDVSGHIPREAIQRVVRQNFGRFRMCYERGLARNPSLEGRIAVRFVIGRDGTVSNVSNGGSSVADADVTSCVLGQFYGLSFPVPENGVVRVTYPLMLQPG